LFNSISISSTSGYEPYGYKNLETYNEVDDKLKKLKIKFEIENLDLEIIMYLRTKGTGN
jgi:hypothetical protein